MSERSPSSNTAGLKFPPPFVYLGGLIVGYLIWWFWPLQFVPQEWSLPIRLLGLVAVALGLWIMITARNIFVKTGTRVNPFEPSTMLVLDGPYRFTRNPMYLGMALVLGGLALIGNALWPFLALAPVIAIIRTQVIAKEEAYLEAKFVAPYRDFKARVRRWI